MKTDNQHIRAKRLYNQHVNGKRLNSVAEVVSHMGAMQAQDFNMVKWALGARLPGVTEKEILRSFNAGEIIRTHLLRPTWHMVVPDDIQALLHLTAPRIQAAARSRHRQLEIDAKLIARCNDLIAKALSGKQHKTREELMDILERKGIHTGEQRGTHLMFCAELDGIVCSGEMRNKQQTYALLQELVPWNDHIDADEALEKLSRKYFTSHGPATAKDFSWWSGLSLSMANEGIEMIRKDFVSESYEGNVYWSRSNEKSSAAIHLLPAFDEFTISYRDRTASIGADHHRKAISNNGIFRPIVIVNGRVEGLWKKTVKGKTVILEVSMFDPLPEKMISKFTSAVARYEKFLQQKVELHIK